MSRQILVKLIFVDGPLEGQTKFVEKDEFMHNRTYRAYIPSLHSKEKTPELGVAEFKVVCTQVEYIPFNIPSSYGTERFIMCQQNMGLGN